jgi:stage II sporulation protein D
LLHQEADHREAAEHLASTLENRGFGAVINQIKKKMLRSSKLGTEFSYQVLLKPIFYSDSEAKAYQTRISDQLTTTVLPFFESRPKGSVILISEDTGQQFHSPGMIRIQGKLFTLKTTIGRGYHFEGEQQRTYRKRLEFWIDRFGGLTVVNEIPIEIYLRGVIGSEMNSKFPLEALKAQAITARGYTLAWTGKLHRLSPFDLCDEVHCHVYGGVDREAASVNEAVEQTRGQVLMYGDEICDTRYAGVCGGHSENNEDVWNNAPQPYLRGRLDSKFADSFRKNYLIDENHVRQWIESSPDVFCNTTQIPVPDALEYTKKYFRWSVRYSTDELSRIITNKTGKNIGTLTDIIPLERGVSGRLKKVELRGTRRSIIVERELEIRKALSPNYLYSSCFVVDRAGNDFIIKGAGWGHGVGMCQTGAAIMALNGYRYREILNHYYQNSKIVKLY